MKKILIVLILVLSNCGYQPLYTNNNSENLVFKKINFEGNKKINRKIISALNFSENESDYNYDELILNTKKNIQTTSKNDKGQAISYNQIIETFITIKNNDNIIKQKSFIVNFSYNTKDNKFDLVEYEEQIENNLINEIIEELNIYINIK